MRTHHPVSTRSRFVLAVVISASALGVGGCARPAPVTASAAAHSPPAIGPSLPHGWQRCVNPVENYSIGYPGNWYTAQIRPEEVCAQFHPSRFTIPAESEYPLTALNAKSVPALPRRID